MSAPAQQPRAPRQPAPPLQVVMPMGGLGTRFRAVGVTTPKPLIDVLGVPMFTRALASFDAYPGERRLVVVVREDDDREHALARRVLQASPGADVVLLDHDTRGAVETVLTAAPRLDPELPMVVMDCDIAFEAPGYPAAVARAAATGDVDGLLLSFTSTDPRYSFAEVGPDGLVVRTAEKRAISSDALMGAYTFLRAQLFLDAGRRLLQEQISSAMPEYYVSLVFNTLIGSGHRIGLVHGDFYCFGTPEELARFEATQLPV